MKYNIQTPTGTQDILPENQKYWIYLSNVFNKHSQSFGLSKISTPMFEYQYIFTKSIGETTDIVEKEMFEVKKFGKNTEQENNDSSPNDALILRPEGTAGVARAYIQHGMQTWPQPVKLYYEGSMFRYERPQRGRFRELHQLGVEILGDAEPLTDCLTILLMWQIFMELNLSDNLIIDINSIGCKNCRPKFKKKISEYFQSYKSTLCDDCNRRLESNPLRLFDCKQDECQKISEGAPQLIDLLCLECKNHFMKVLEYLDELSIPYDLNPKLVRGLDYYSRTAFEIRDINDTNRQCALGGGGRYDYLVESFGGPSTPAVGWALGMERIIEKLKEKEIFIPEIQSADIFIVQIGEKARKKALSVLIDLRSKGFNVSCVMGKDSLKSQLRSADKMGSKIALIIGQREALDESVIIKDMVEASQETVDIKDLEEILRKKINKNDQT